MTMRTAIDIKHDLLVLHEELELINATALADDPLYMADLEEEIVATRNAYVGSAVMEIAFLRAELYGPHWG